MSTLVICRGLPASGKSTWAEEWITNDPAHRLSVSRDFIRLSVLRMPSTLGNKRQETLVTSLQRQMVQEALLNGWSVCVDDTNLPQSRAKDWADLAQRCRAQFEVKDFTHVSVEICVERDANRLGTPKYVGWDVIRSMHSRFLASGNFSAVVEARVEPEPAKTYVRNDACERDAFIFDIDGTLALMSGRSPYEWHRVGEDKPNEWVVNLARALSEVGYGILCVSGRDEVSRGLTEAWLEKYNVPYDELHMRPQGDTRKDSIVKSEIFFGEIADKWYVHGVFDDRNQVVEFWRSIGVPCAQVALGEF